MKKTKHPLNTWAFLGIYLAILAVFAGVYTLSRRLDQASQVPIVGTYTPGTYTASDYGFGGQVSVSLTVGPNGGIDDVTLDAPNETDTIGGAALPALRNQILSAQSDEIDGVSGATLTSTGVRNAVTQALAAASGQQVSAANAPAEGALFVPGTYEKTARGFGGDCTVTLTVSDNEITDVIIDGSSETENIGSFAVTLLQKSILENQTTKVDAISGATVTSNAILNAANQALNAAGADLSKLPAAETPEIATADKAQQTVETDVVVVGAGGAGMTAAINAAHAGKNVLIVEKMPYAGGNSTKATGGMNAAGTKYQAQIEFTNAKGVENTLATAKEKWAGNEAITALAETVQKQWDAYQADPQGYFDTPELMALDTMIGGKGINDPALVTTLTTASASAIDWLDTIGAPLPKLAFSGGASVSRIHSPADGNGVGAYLVTSFLKVLDDMQIPVMYNTRATSIIMEDGKAVGIQAESPDTVYTVRAKSVVLATGGYGANMDMITQYKPSLAGSVTTNAPGATGDGIVMATAVGAATRDLDQIQLHPTVEQGTSMLITEGVRGDGAILVNQQGLRFVNEMLTRDQVSAAELQQEGSCAYVIFDQRLREGLKASEKYIKTGIVEEAPTIDELGEKLGMDGSVLAKTLADWNGYVAAQNDPDFGRATAMDHDLSQGPYYAIKVAPGIHHTMGGLVIDTEAHVLNENHQPIPGLFAAGEVTGGVHGGNRLGGNAVSDIVVFGKIAGTNAAAYCD